MLNPILEAYFRVQFSSICKLCARPLLRRIDITRNTGLRLSSQRNSAEVLFL